MKMTRRCLALVLALLLALSAMGALAASKGIKIDEKHFPDAHFRSFLADPENSVDDDGDGYLSQEELNDAEYMGLSYMGIESLQGIGYFTNLTDLELDGNKLKSLDVSKNKKLAILTCTENKLTSLKLGSQSRLELLDCSFNPDLKSLDIGGCPKLKAAVKSKLDWASSSYAIYGFSGDRPIVTCNARLKLTSGKTVLRKYAKPSSVAFSKKSLSLKKGWTGDLFEKGVYIKMGAKTYPVKYSSSNSKVVKVASDGRITAKKKGTATITVKSGGKKGKIKITVK